MIPSQLLKGVLEGCILEIIQKQETYAYEISEKLKEVGFGEISEGTIYPIILRLNKKGWLDSVMRKSAIGPKRKYYHLTPEGEKALKAFETDWAHLQLAINHLFEGERTDGQKLKASYE